MKDNKRKKFNDLEHDPHYEDDTDFCYKEESTLLPEVTTEEEKYFLDSDDIPCDSIKYEFNMIEFPFFSKDKHVKDHTEKKYTFDEKKDQFVLITPPSGTHYTTHKVPQEFDEKIFYAISKLLEEQNSTKYVIADYYTIMKYANIKYDGRTLERTKEALQRLQGSNIHIKNLYYDAFARSMGMKTFSKSTANFSIIDSLVAYTLKKVLNLDGELRDKAYKYFQGRKIEEIIVIRLNENLMNNLDAKGYKYFKASDLLEIDNSIARKLFILLTKWKFWEKTDYIVRTSRFLSSRIPLSWKDKNIKYTVNALEKAFGYLKKLGKIEDYELIKDKTYAQSKFKIYFIKVEVLDDINKKLSVETGTEMLEMVDEIEITVVPAHDVVPVERIEEIQKKIEEIIKVNISMKAIETMINEKGEEQIQLYLNNWDKFQYKNIGNVAKFFEGAVLKSYDIPVSQKGTDKSKVPQETNYDQRKYDDDFYKSLYDNINSD